MRSMLWNPGLEKQEECGEHEWRALGRGRYYCVWCYAELKEQEELSAEGGDIR